MSATPSILWRRQLPRPLCLGDVADVETLCRTIVATSGIYFADSEDAVAWLLGEAWVVWKTEYDPGRGVPFGPFARVVLGYRLREYIRQQIGRNGHKKPPPGFSLDEPQQSLGHAGDEPEECRLEQALRGGGGDPADGSDPALARILAGPGRRGQRVERGARVEHPRAATG